MTALRARPATMAALAAAALLASAELALRATGYASPLIYVADADYEYFPAPDQRTHRFGIRISTNRFGMRSPDFDPATDARERILVLGDSVVQGGNWTDQDALATSRLSSEDRLVLNVSAGSWGPGNLLSYVQRHGLFGAERVVLVLSSHDAYDNRTFSPPHGYATPTRRPRLALARFIDQYVLSGPDRESARIRGRGVDDDARSSLDALLGLLGSGRACVVLHWSADEIAGDAEAPMRTIAALAAAHDVAVVSTEDAYKAALARGETIYRDQIHLNDAGQALLAESMNACLELLTPAR